MLKQIIFAILAFVITMVCCELFIRSSYIGMVSTADFDPSIGKVQRKDVSYLFFNEGMGVGAYNEYGYLGEGYPEQRTPNTVRVALLGDSYVAGLQVMQRHHFRTLLEDKLSSTLSKEVEILNFGKPGSDLYDIYTYKENYVDRFSPDYYLIFVSPWDFFPKRKDPLQPVPVLKENELAIDMEFKETAIANYEQVKPLIQNSAILNMARQGVKKTKSVPLGSILLDKVWTWFNPPVDQSEGGWDFDFSEIPSEVPAIVGELDPKKVIFVNREIKPLPETLTEMISGHSYVDLSTILSDEIYGEDSPIAWPITSKVGHWNQKGHKIVSDYLATYMTATISHPQAVE